MVQSTKYTETGEEISECFISRSNIRLIRQLKVNKDNTTVTFKSNIKFVNESANPIYLTVVRREIVRDDDE
jgi:hypothetical protein